MGLTTGLFNSQPQKVYPDSPGSSWTTPNYEMTLAGQDYSQWQAEQDWLRRQRDHSLTMATGSQQNSNAQALARIRQQPAQDFTAAWSRAQDSGNNFLAALLNQRGGQDSQGAMKQNWNSLGSMLGGRYG